MATKIKDKNPTPKILTKTDRVHHSLHKLWIMRPTRARVTTTSFLVVASAEEGRMYRDMGFSSEFKDRESSFYYSTFLSIKQGRWGQSPHRPCFILHSSILVLDVWHQSHEASALDWTSEVSLGLGWEASAAAAHHTSVWIDMSS